MQIHARAAMSRVPRWQRWAPDPKARTRNDLS